MNPRGRLLEEICKNVNLEDHREPFSSLLDMILESGVKVSTRYDVPSSNYEEYIETDPRIRISLINIVDPLDVVWNTMHEFGHYLSGKRKPEDHTLDREELAWIHADTILQQFPYFLSFRNKYEICKQKCLHSYREYFRPKSQNHE